jgi:hypothetical protein
MMAGIETIGEKAPSAANVVVELVPPEMPPLQETVWIHQRGEEEVEP